MMDASALLGRLLAEKNKDERRALLETRQRLLDTAFFQRLKERVLELALENSQEALRVAEIGLEATEFAAEQEGVAYAWWAKGNALLFLGHHDDCLAAYATAISIFAGLGRAGQVAQLQTNCMSPLMWTGRYAEAQAMGRSALQVLADQGETRPLASLLLSMGACARRQGDHAGALAQAEQAAVIFDRLGDAVQAARCWITQAVALEHLDRFEEAERLLQEALRVFAGQGKWLPWARTALNLGVLRARLADHQVALRWMEQSRRAFLDAGVEMDAAIADLYRAQSLLDLNLLPEAKALGEELVETFSRLKMSRQVARAAALLADVYARLGQTEQAQRELERARRIFHVAGDALEEALLDLRRAALLQNPESVEGRAVGQPGVASRLASDAAGVLDVHRYPLRHAEAHLVLAACCEDMGMLQEAQLAYRVAWTAGSHPTGTTEPPPVLAYRIAHARGTLAEAAGDRALARGEYDRAVRYLGRIARGLGLDELRGGYLSDKRSVYEAALRLALEDDRLDDAFRTAESARAGALRDCIRNRQHAATTTGEDEPDKLAELKARWAWRVSALHRSVDLVAEAEEEVVKPEDRSARLHELADLERELTQAFRHRRLADPSTNHRGELVEPFASASRSAAERTGQVPRFAVLEQGQVLELDQVRKRLADETALLAFDHVGDRLLAFVVTPHAADVVQVGSLARLRWQAAGLGHTLEEVRLFDSLADLAMLEADLVAELQTLYQAVLAKPLARLGPESRRLLIVPCDVLYTLPLVAFHDGERYLLERYTLSYLPSASLLGALPIPAGDGTHPPLVMGHSWEGRLPLALEEAARVAGTLASTLAGEPLLLTEAEATATALREHAGAARLLHVAAHGAFRGDAPLFSSLHLADGLLTVNDVYGLDLSQAALVTLSGCQTGLGQGWGGEMLGLTHAFFFAGAPTLAVSRWRVDDAATADLMQDFYGNLARGEPVAEALRVAQLGMLARRPHAYYWAGFAVWGQGFHSLFSGR